MMPPNIYDYIQQEESNFEKDEIQVGDNWYWNFRNHVQLIFHLKNGVFYTGENKWLRAFKNIMEPILNLSYWTEDLEVKDVVFYIENGQTELSFLIKKYHDEIYVKEHDLDMLFDEITESDLDYGGVINQNAKGRPETLPLNTVAFCDQTDVMGSPIAFKHSFSPSKLKEMSKFGWGDKKNGATISLDELCVLASEEKDPIGTLGKQKNRVTGKVIDVYLVRGNLPNAYLYDDDDMDYSTEQVQIVACYADKDNKKQYVILYRKKDSGNMKFFTSKKIPGRALGRGVGETLLNPQIWTNFLTIHKMNMLEAGSKVPLYTDDSTYTQKNKIQDMETLEITTIEDGKRIYQVPTIAPTNIQLYANEINDWYLQAQLAGSAQDPLLGKEAPSGTTFKGQERSVAQGRGIHDRRRGQRAKYIEEIYRDWIIPEIKKEITKDREFIATLTTEELMWVSDRVVTNAVNKRVKEMILAGKVVTPQEREAMKQIHRAEFLKKGNQHVLKILKDDFKDIEIKMGISIGNKQKNLADLSDKVLSIFQFIFQNPQGFMQSMQIPALAKSFENILEFSGLSLSDFSSLLNAPMPTPTEQPQVATPSPLQTEQLLQPTV